MAAVLVIDDDAAVRRVVALSLSTAGFAVQAAENGLGGMLAVEKEQPDLIVVDLSMPVMDGREFCRMLRENGYKMPVIVLSAYGADEWAAMGAQAAMSKPFDPDALIAMIAGLLDENVTSGKSDL